jgi:hypothetical protein
MSKIPYITERAVPQAQGLNSVPVTVADTSAVPQATAQLGQSLMKAGEAISVIKERQDKFNYSIAYSKFLQKSINYQNDLDQDPDYTNAPQKYKEGMAAIKDQALKELGSNNYAPELKEHMNLYEAKNYGQVLDSATKKQSAAALATVDQQVNANFEAFSRTKDPEARFGLLASSVTAFSNAIPDSDPNKAVKVQQFTDQIEKRGALLDLSQRSPQQQIALLRQENAKSGSNIAKYLTPEERSQALERAEQSQKQQQSQDITAIRNADYLKKRAAENRANDLVIHGGNVKDLPIEDYVLLDQETKNNLTKTAEIYSGAIKVDENDSKKELYSYLDLYHNKPEEFAKVDPVTISSRLSPADAKVVFGWQQKAISGVVMPVDLATRNEIANQTLNSIGLPPNNNKDSIKFKNRLNEEVEYFKKNHQKEPNQKELQEMAHSLVVQATFDRGYFGSTKAKPLYQASKKEIEKQVVVPDDFANKLISQSRAAGMGPLTPEQIRTAYINKISK